MFDNRSWCYYWRHFPAWFSFSAKSFHKKKPSKFEKNEKIVVLLNDWLKHLCVQEPDFAPFFFFFFLLANEIPAIKTKTCTVTLFGRGGEKGDIGHVKSATLRWGGGGWGGGGGLAGWAKVVVQRPNSLPFPFRTPRLLKKAKKWNTNFLLECSAQKKTGLLFLMFRCSRKFSDSRLFFLTGFSETFCGKNWLVL